MVADAGLRERLFGDGVFRCQRRLGAQVMLYNLVQTALYLYYPLHAARRAAACLAAAAAGGRLPAFPPPDRNRRRRDRSGSGSASDGVSRMLVFTEPRLLLTGAACA